MGAHLRGLADVPPPCACRSFGVVIGVVAVMTRIRPAYWTAARLVLVALAATFAAMTVSTVVRSRLSVGQRAPSPRALEESRPAPSRPVADYYAMTRRNLFAVPPTSEATSSGGSSAGPASLRLVGTGRRGGVRYAIVEDLTAKRQEVVRVGDALGGGKVSAIGWRRLELDRNGSKDVMTVAADPTPAAPAEAAARPAAAAPAAGPSDEQIRKIGEDRFLVAQAEVEHSLENLSDLFTQLRAVPNVEAGQTNGFKIFAIKRGSIFQKVGLENNDVIQRVNGVELNDPTRAMALFQELQGQNRLTVDVMRGGQARTLTYEIR